MTRWYYLRYDQTLFTSMRSKPSGVRSRNTMPRTVAARTAAASAAHAQRFWMAHGRGRRRTMRGFAGAGPWGAGAGCKTMG